MALSLVMAPLRWSWPPFAGHGPLSLVMAPFRWSWPRLVVASFCVQLQHDSEFARRLFRTLRQQVFFSPIKNLVLSHILFIRTPPFMMITVAGQGRRHDHP
jgi:hypothetical protein